MGRFDDDDPIIDDDDPIIGFTIQGSAWYKYINPMERSTLAITDIRSPDTVYRMMTEQALMSQRIAAMFRTYTQPGAERSAFKDIADRAQYHFGRMIRNNKRLLDHWAISEPSLTDDWRDLPLIRSGKEQDDIYTELKKVADMTQFLLWLKGEFETYRARFPKHANEIQGLSKWLRHVSNQSYTHFNGGIQGIDSIIGLLSYAF